MKILLSSILAVTALLCGCAANKNAWRTNGNLQVNIQVPEGLVGQPVNIYIDGNLVNTSTNLTETISLPPYWRYKMKVEMAGTKSFNQSVKVEGNGSNQVLEVALAKQ